MLIFDLRAMSWLKGKERGIEVVEGVTKDSLFDDKMELKAQNGELRSNDTLETENGKIVQFKEGSYKKILKNNKARKEGKLVAFEEYLNAKESIEREIG